MESALPEDLKEEAIGLLKKIEERMGKTVTMELWSEAFRRRPQKGGDIFAVLQACTITSSVVVGSLASRHKIRLDLLPVIHPTHPYHVLQGEYDSVEHLERVIQSRAAKANRDEVEQLYGPLTEYEGGLYSDHTWCCMCQSYPVRIDIKMDVNFLPDAMLSFRCHRQIPGSCVLEYKPTNCWSRLQVSRRPHEIVVCEATGAFDSSSQMVSTVGIVRVPMLKDCKSPFQA